MDYIALSSHPIVHTKGTLNRDHQEIPRQSWQARWIKHDVFVFVLGSNHCFTTSLFPLKLFNTKYTHQSYWPRKTYEARLNKTAMQSA